MILKKSIKIELTEHYTSITYRGCISSIVIYYFENFLLQFLCEAEYSVHSSLSTHFDIIEIKMKHISPSKTPLNIYFHTKRKSKPTAVYLMELRHENFFSTYLLLSFRQTSFGFAFTDIADWDRSSSTNLQICCFVYCFPVKISPLCVWIEIDAWILIYLENYHNPDILILSQLQIPDLQKLKKIKCMIGPHNEHFWVILNQFLIDICFL